MTDQDYLVQVKLAATRRAAVPSVEAGVIFAVTRGRPDPVVPVVIVAVEATR